MNFIQEAAGKYLGSEDKPSAGGSGGGLDWSHLSGLAEEFQAADKGTGGELNPSKFKQFFGAGQGQSGAGAGGVEGKPAGGANSDVIHQLLALFKKENNGQSFTGQMQQYEQLQQIAERVTGRKIPVSVLEKLVKWKTSGSL